MKSQYHKLFVFFALLLVMSLACSLFGGPTATEAPAVEEPPAAEPPQAEEPASEPTEAPAATEPPVEETSAEQYFTEEFEGSLENWSQELALNASDGDTSQANIVVEDGRVVFDFGKWLIGYIFYDPFEYEDVRVDVSVENRGTNINNILLVCRASEEGHYLVNVANSGLFAMYAYNGDKGSYSRIADGGSNKIKAGKEVNEYALVCKERKLILYINGNEVRSYTDNQFVFREGQIGVGVASENQLPVKVEFDWVKISEP